MRHAGWTDAWAAEQEAKVNAAKGKPFVPPADPGTRPARRSKFNNRKTTTEHGTFDSDREATWFAALKLREAAGEVRHVARQRPFAITVNQYPICVYVSDATYEERNERGEWVAVVADAKGFKTKEYILKRKLMLACLNIRIVEV